MSVTTILIALIVVAVLLLGIIITVIVKSRKVKPADEYDDEYDEEFEEDENTYSDALDLEGATRQIELPKRNAKKEEDDFSLDFINLDE